MSSFNVYFVRHGQTLLNKYRRLQGWSDSPLTDKGIRDAQAAGKRLSTIQFDAAYSSDMLRTQATAKYILAANSIQADHAQPRYEFREQNFGYFEGQNSGEAMALIGAPFGAANFNEMIKLVGIEKMRDIFRETDTFHDADNDRIFWERLNGGFELLKRNHHAGQNILVVSHGTTIRSIISKYGDGQYDPSASIINGSDTKLVFSENGTIQIEYINRI